MGLVLSGEDLLKTLEFMTSSQLAWDCKTRKRLCEENMLKFKCPCIS